MGDRRDIAIARRMTPEVRLFAAGFEEASRNVTDDHSKVSSPGTQDAPARSATPSSEIQTSTMQVPSFQDRAQIEWKQYSGRLPVDLLRSFKQLCLQREILGLRPNRQQELLSEAVQLILQRYSLHGQVQHQHEAAVENREAAAQFNEYSTQDS